MRSRTAHEMDVMHGDIKPENVFLAKRHDQGALTTSVKLLDFGIAKLMNQNKAGTFDGRIEGTPRYMAPEQFTDKFGSMGSWSDVYAVGHVSYEMLAGHPTFEPPGIVLDRFGLELAQLTTEPVDIREIRPDVPSALATLIHRCLQKNPKDRPKNGREIALALDHLDQALRGKRQLISLPAISDFDVPLDAFRLDATTQPSPAPAAVDAPVAPPAQIVRGPASPYSPTEDPALQNAAAGANPSEGFFSEPGVPHDASVAEGVAVGAASLAPITVGRVVVIDAVDEPPKPAAAPMVEAVSEARKKTTLRLYGSGASVIMAPLRIEPALVNAGVAAPSIDAEITAPDPPEFLAEMLRAHARDAEAREAALSQVGQAPIAGESSRIEHVDGAVALGVRAELGTREASEPPIDAEVTAPDPPEFLAQMLRAHGLDAPTRGASPLDDSPRIANDRTNDVEAAAPEKRPERDARVLLRRDVSPSMRREPKPLEAVAPADAKTSEERLPRHRIPPNAAPLNRPRPPRPMVSRSVKPSAATSSNASSRTISRRRVLGAHFAARLVFVCIAGIVVGLAIAFGTAPRAKQSSRSVATSTAPSAPVIITAQAASIAPATKTPAAPLASAAPALEKSAPPAATPEIRRPPPLVPARALASSTAKSAPSIPHADLLLTEP